MVERVARSVYEKRNGHGCTPWSRLPNAHKEPYFGDARAAIEAMWTKPTEAMVIAAMTALAQARDPYTDLSVQGESDTVRGIKIGQILAMGSEMEAILADMISAALGEA